MDNFDTQKTQPLPGQKLYSIVRANLIANGSTLNSWCKDHGYAHGNVRAALLGKWNGPKAEVLRNQLLELVND